MQRQLSLFAAVVLLAGSAGAQSRETAVAATSATLNLRNTDPAARRATATAASAMRVQVAPVLDGKTDDPAWESAQIIDQFLEYEPNEGRESRFRTEVRVTYDDKNLFVMARMYDPAPDSIISLLSRRDVRTQSEQLKLVIDSYHDKKTGFDFITNPAGVK